MTDGYYSFDETDALLETLSASSMPTLSPFNMESTSKSSSAYSASPNSNNFVQDDWSLNRFDAEEFPKFDLNNNEGQNDFSNTQNFSDNMFPSPSSGSEAISPPFLENGNKFNLIKEDDENDDYGDVSSSNSNKDEDSEATLSKLRSTITSSASANKVTKPKKDRSSHTVIEKKYRTNINTKITALRDAVPSLRVACGDKDTKIDDLDGLSPPSKINKATIFTKATEYIKHLESKNGKLQKENQQLKQLLSSYAPQSQTPQNFSYTQPLQQAAAPQPLSQFQPATDFNGNPINIVSQQPNYQLGLPGKMLMGGLTVMAGQSMFNGQNYDQYGLSAFPMLSTPQFAIFITFAKILLCLSSVAYIFAPTLFSSSKNEKATAEKLTATTIHYHQWYGLVKELLFIHTGDLKKTEASEAEVQVLVNSTLLNTNSEPVSIYNLVYLLMRLHSFKSNFEVAFGKIIIAKLLLSYSSLFESIFFVSSILNSIIDENLNEISRNQKINDTNIRYFFKEFNSSSSSFMKSECFKRLLNVSLGLPFDTNCTRGLNDKGYEMILRDEEVVSDYKSTLISLRTNELFREVLLEYINLTFNDKYISGMSNDEVKELKIELWNKLSFCENLAPKHSVVDIKVKLFKSICNEKHLDAVLNLINDEGNFDEINEEQYSDFEDEIDGDTVASSGTSRQASLRFKKILSQELFNSLVCSTILKSISRGNSDQVSQLLHYLRLNKSEISLLSFISMFKIIDKFPKTWVSEADKYRSFLNQVIGVLRLWIGDLNNQNFRDLENEGIQFKREISDKLVEVSKIFNEF